MKKLFLFLLFLTLPGSAWAGPPITQGINTGALGAITADSVTVNALKYWANYSGHGFVRTSSAGAVNDSAEFEVGSDGTVNLIRATANIVVGAACANAKICISTAATQNPVIVQARNGAEQVEIEFWYH